MTAMEWKTSHWPEGVPHTLKNYKFPLFQLLDNSAEKYPNNVYTIFQGASKTFSQVKDTVDRVANFLISKGIKKGDKVKAYIKVKEGETATKEEIMAGYKRPREIEFRDEIPMSNVGKILRRALRDEVLAE